jgi:protein translocase SecG subunit
MHEIVIRILEVLIGIVAIGLTVLVVLQDNRGGGLAGVLAGYGGDSAFGTETVSQVKKLTAYLGALFFALVLAVAILAQAGGGGVIGEGLESTTQEQTGGMAPDAGEPSVPAPSAPATE